MLFRSAKKKDENPELTWRFELFICGHEYANAFSELNDPVDQEERFAAQMQAKAAGIVKDRWEMREIISREFKVKTF